MRHANWEERLIAVLDAHFAKPFAWGSADCMQMLMAAEEAVLGKHPYPEAIGYKTRAGAALCLKRHGFATIEEPYSTRFAAVHPLSAWRGDAGFLDIKGNLYALVCAGREFIGKSETGTLRVPPHRVLRAYRVD